MRGSEGSAHLVHHKTRPQRNINHMGDWFTKKKRSAEWGNGPNEKHDIDTVWGSLEALRQNGVAGPERKGGSHAVWVDSQLNGRKKRSERAKKGEAKIESEFRGFRRSEERVRGPWEGGGNQGQKGGSPQGPMPTNFNTVVDLPPTG